MAGTRVPGCPSLSPSACISADAHPSQPPCMGAAHPPAGKTVLLGVDDMDIFKGIELKLQASAGERGQLVVAPGTAGQAGQASDQLHALSPSLPPRLPALACHGPGPACRHLSKCWRTTRSGGESLCWCRSPRRRGEGQQQPPAFLAAEAGSVGPRSCAVCRLPLCRSALPPGLAPASAACTPTSAALPCSAPAPPLLCGPRAAMLHSTPLTPSAVMLRPPRPPAPCPAGPPARMWRTCSGTCWTWWRG